MAPKAELVMGMPLQYWTIQNQIQSTRISTRYMQVVIEYYRVSISVYMWQKQGLVVIDDSISKVFLLLYKRNILILRAFLGFYAFRQIIPVSSASTANTMLKNVKICANLVRYEHCCEQTLQIAYHLIVSAPDLHKIPSADGFWNQKTTQKVLDFKWKDVTKISFIFGVCSRHLSDAFNRKLLFFQFNIIKATR